MKIEKSTIFVGDTSRDERHLDKGTKNDKGGMTLDGSKIKSKFDPIATKKKEAQKRAMNLISNAVRNELKVDESVEERRQKIAELSRARGEASKKISEIEKKRAELTNQYQIDPEGEEEANLKLLEKEIDAKLPGSKTTISAEEAEKIKKIKEEGLTEYQKRSLDLKKTEVPYVNEIYAADQEISLENSIIQATSIERMKSNYILKAQKQADAINKEASNEIKGMLMDEVKQHIEETYEEEREEVKKKEEEKEKIEERIDKAKERKHEQEKNIEEIIEASAEMQGDTTEVANAQKEIKEILNKLKLIEDDIKGASVDRIV